MSQTNDHHRAEGNLSAGQNSAYDLLLSLLIYNFILKQMLTMGKQKLSKKKAEFTFGLFFIYHHLRRHRRRKADFLTLPALLF